MNHHLTFKDDKSDKFWNIEVSGNSFTVTYGKTGTAGTSQTKTFDNEEICVKEAQKLLSEKLKKGYIEGNTQTFSQKEKTSAQTPNDFRQEWEKIVNSKDLQKDLIKHFSYLVDSTGFEPVLHKIFEHATGAKINGNTLIVEFKNGNTLTAEPPGNSNSYKKFPKSFLKLIEKHNTLKTNRIELGKCYFDFDIFDDGDRVYEIFDGKESNVFCPLKFTDNSDWIYHPTEKNKEGEPAIFPVIHELEDEINLEYYNIGSLFLKELCDEFEIEIEIPIAERPADPFADLKTNWWNNLSEVWKQTFRSQSENKDKEPTFESILTLEKLNLTDSAISDLKPLEALLAEKKFKLEIIRLADTSVSDIAILALAKKKLFSVDISGTPVKDVSMLKEINFLTADRCTELDFSTVTKLKKLRQLSLQDTKLNDLEFLHDFTELEQLNINGTPLTDEQIQKFQIRFNKDRLEKNKTVSYGRDPLKLDIHPEIKDPLLRALADNSDYKPELALEVGEKLLAQSAERKDIKQILKDMISICDKQWRKYLYIKTPEGEKKYEFFNQKEKRFQYILETDDFSTPVSIMSVSDPIAEITSLIPFIYENKKKYKAFCTIKDDSFYHVNAILEIISKTKYHDVTLAQIEEAVKKSNYVEYKIKENGDMYIKVKK
ncbi:WGR domain-containing protein [Leptospira kirschneri]|uniref:WGR domain protein n=1 Tax=Leptospira kirschneri str. 200802841 TaxID=1193047 RepID=A0A828Y3C2_9LEPT|nr:WGR domain-containing protein [Leptospira kirschneri]EJO68304.1 WGR domain protein [Leptospira kirschneri serovar Grippotyphosa str. RM52]EKO51984.1 WGR domain protein [Leptospira kirschneri str. 200802841]EMO82304.1 WGR domain protein [Leptospira kirschneri str. 200801774]EPG49157.1 WGR domain protein [Leptospira kirschneri serovar Cynopteri str. 3522 CT]